MLSKGRMAMFQDLKPPQASDKADKLLEAIKAAPEEDRLKIVYDAIDATLVPLATAEWTIWVDRAKTLLGKRLDRNKLEKAHHEAIATQRAAAAQDAAQRRRQQDPRPDIEVASDIAPPVDALQAALLACPHTPLYQRGRFLCHIGIGGPKIKWLQRPPDMPQILLTSAAHLRELASRAARFWVDNGKSVQLAPPPVHIIETLMARPAWEFPALEGIVHIPTLCPDGTLVMHEGYQPDAALFLDFNGVTFPPLPHRLGLDAARTAICRLQEVFIDFPYVNPMVHFSATLAALLSCVCRYAILGHVPMFAVRSTTRGSGKGKLIDAISLIALGRSAPRMAQTQDEEEERKRLLSLALAAMPLLHIDNVTHPLGSGPLDLALTAPTVGDRMLGKNEHREASLITVFFASGNQMQFRGDMARRVIPIDLDPKQANPEERDDFQHPELEKWVAEQRPRLVMDALTIMQAYFAAGAPQQKLPAFGSYEAWSTLIRQVLVWAGEADPTEARRDVEAESDPKYEMRDKLLHAWETRYGTKPKTVNEVVQDITLCAATRPNPPNAWDELRDTLGAFDRRYDGQKLDKHAVGEGIRAMQGLVIAGRRFVKDGTLHRAIRWKIERLS